jgi:hypothetical protein
VFDVYRFYVVRAAFHVMDSWLGNTREWIVTLAIVCFVLLVWLHRQTSQPTIKGD